MSETVFILTRAASEVKIAIHTLLGELPFAGHPVVGTTVFLLGGSPISSEPKSTVLQTLAGPMPAHFHESRAFISVAHNVKLHTATLSDSADYLAKCFKTKRPAPESLQLFSIVKHMTFLLARLPDLDRLSDAKPPGSSIELSNLPADEKPWVGDLVALYLYVLLQQSTQSDGTQLYSIRTRMFEALLEDPATGKCVPYLIETQAEQSGAL